MSFSTEKNALIALVKANGCTAAGYINGNMMGYGDMPAVYFKWSKAFDSNNSYLDDIAGLFSASDSSLTTNGIYYNKNASGVIANPKIILKTTIHTIEFNSGGTVEHVEIGNLSNVPTVTIKNDTNIKLLVVTGGSIVQNLVIEPGSSIDVLTIISENSLISEVRKATGEAGSIGNVSPGENSVWNGLECSIFSL